MSVYAGHQIKVGGKLPLYTFIPQMKAYPSFKSGQYKFWKSWIGRSFKAIAGSSLHTLKFTPISLQYQ